MRRDWALITECEASTKRLCLPAKNWGLGFRRRHWVRRAAFVAVAAPSGSAAAAAALKPAASQASLPQSDSWLPGNWG